MNIKKQNVGFEESLKKDVVLTHRCLGCAACTIVCPFNSLEYADEHPMLVKRCESCGICVQVCPKFGWSCPKMEKLVFGRHRRESEEFGIYRRLVLAQAADKTVLKKCQDGGAVTAILMYALQKGLIEGVALSGVAADKPFYPLPKLATTSEEVVENAGTRYSYSPNILALQEGVKQSRRRLAFVGTPCQIQAIRRIQMLQLKKYSNPLQFTVGLMCSESFSYDGLFETYISKKMGVDPHDIVKMSIKGKMNILLKSKKEKSIPLSEVKQYARGCCRYCSDFSAELADISAGGLGLSEWTFIILRTEKGEEIFDGAVNAGMLITRPVTQEASAHTLLTGLSNKKRKNSPKD